MQLDTHDIGISNRHELLANLAGCEIEFVKRGLVFTVAVIDEVADIGIAGLEAHDTVDPAQNAIQVALIVHVGFLEQCPRTVARLAVIFLELAIRTIERRGVTRVAIAVPALDARELAVALQHQRLAAGFHVKLVIGARTEGREGIDTGWIGNRVAFTDQDMFGLFRKRADDFEIAVDGRKLVGFETVGITEIVADIRFRFLHHLAIDLPRGSVDEIVGNPLCRNDFHLASVKAAQWLREVIRAVDFKQVFAFAAFDLVHQHVLAVGRDLYGVDHRAQGPDIDRDIRLGLRLARRGDAKTDNRHTCHRGHQGGFQKLHRQNSSI